MQGINLELTTYCPLHCPQCYCSLDTGKNLDIDIAKSKIKEASEHNVKLAHLSGGETMCYPHLYELISYVKECGILPNVALSGYKFDSDVLSRLIASGVNGIFISLNGSTKEINSLTRDGYDLAINALRILRDNAFENTFINWVMHSNNCADFKNVLAIAEEYNVAHLTVLAFKPDSKHELNSFPSGSQIIEIADTIKNYKGKTQIVVETCFSQLLAVLLDTKLFGNFNNGPMKGCRAGVYNYSINVDGLYSPCRHLDYYEKYDSLDEYLANSSIIEMLSKYEDVKREPCASCYYCEHCRPCAAVNSKMKNEIFIGHDICSLCMEKTK